MKYLIKSLKWTKHYGVETWYKPDSNGYTHMIFSAGIYTDEDMKKMTDGITQKVIQFIPLTEKLKKKGIMQLKQNIKSHELDIERANKAIKESEERIELLKEQIISFEKSFDSYFLNQEGAGNAKI